MTSGRMSPMFVLALIIVFAFSVLAFGADEKPLVINKAVSPNLQTPEHVESTVPLVGEPTDEPAEDPNEAAEAIRLEEQNQPAETPGDAKLTNPTYQENPADQPAVSPDPTAEEIRIHNAAAGMITTKDGIKIPSHPSNPHTAKSLYLSEDFGADTLYPFPPTGWDTLNTDPGYGWFQGLYSGGGTRCALVTWHAAGYVQDEWLLTPDVDVSGATSDLKLEFWSLQGYDYPHDFKVHISTDGGTSWTEIFDSYGTGYPEFEWYMVTVDLSAYAGTGNIMVGFQYAGEDADLFGIDDVSINDDAASVGRCCYGDPSAPDCADNYLADCQALGGDWDATMNCTDDPCPTSNPPANDDCANAEAIGDVTDFAWSTAEATLDGADTWIVSPDIWYCYTASCDGNATVSLCGTAWDTRVQVFDGCSCPVGTKIGQDDDACDATIGSTYASQFTFAVTSGSQYMIRIGGYSAGDFGDGIMNISCAGGTPGDNCSDPLAVTLPAALPYTDNNYTCGRINDYANTGLGYYDGGEDIIYALTVTEAITVDISLDPLTTTYTGISISTACPDDTVSMIDYSTNSGAGVHGMTGVSLSAGTYYIMVDTWPSPACIPEFNLTITDAGGPPVGRCCYGDPVSCDDITEADCLALSGTWAAGLNCTDNPCPTGETPANDLCVDAIDITGTYPVTVDGTTIGSTTDCPDAFDNWQGVWYKFDLPYASNNVSIDFCGTPVEMSSISATLMIDCACDTNTMIYYSGGAFADCGDGYATPAFTFDQVPGPVTVYYVVAADAAKSDGMDFHFEVDVTEYTLPTGRCCYGDPLAPSCDDVTEPDCAGLGGTWAAGLNCTDNPCPIAGPGDDCSDPLTDIKFPADLPWADLGQTTCGHGNFYAAADMCYTYGYGGGEDLVYEFEVDETITIQITMDPKGTGWWFVQLSDVCIPSAGECIYYFRSTVGDPLTSAAITLAPGIYYMIVDTWPAPDCIPAFDLSIATAVPPQGRCCYGDPMAPSCAENTEAECMALSGDWSEGLNCTDNPCIPVTSGNDCTDPFMVKIPDDLPFENMNYTCERGNNYATTCLGSYDGGEDIIYELDVDGTIILDITLDPHTTTWTGIAIFDGCPDVGTCIDYSTVTGATVHGLEGVALTTGLYYIMIDTYPAPDCIPDFTLTIVEAGQAMGRCCYGDGMAPSCADETETACLSRPDWLSFAAGLNCTDNPCQAYPDNDNCADANIVTLASGVPSVVNGDNTNATSDCDDLAPATEAWEAFTIDTTMNVTIEYCGTTPSFDLVYIVLYANCPCDIDGGIFATTTNWDACGDGNITMFFEALAPGTYYLPVLAFHPDYPTDYYQGPYTITFTGTAVSPDYCSASGGCDEYISRVAVAEIDNSSACDGYADYTGMIASMPYGAAIPITVENGNPYTADQCAVFIDWNGDLDFADADETIALDVSVGNGPYTGTINVPVTAVSGLTRMRVRINYSAVPPPCGVTTYGEVEDYTVNVGGEQSVLTIDPASIDFGTVPVDATGNTQLTLGADGSANIMFSFDYDYAEKKASVGGGQCSENLKANPFQASGHAPAGDKNAESIFFEGFEGGTIPPTGWTTVVNNAFTWEIDTYAPYEGAYNATCLYDENYTGTQDEWLVSPVIDLSGGTYALDIWWNGSFYWSVDPYDNCNLEVWISTDGGATWLVELWNEDSFGTFVNWEWNNSVIDLSPFAGQSNVKLGFRYYGYDGAQFGLDAIDVYEFTPPLNWLSATPESGTIPGGGTLPITVSYNMAGLEEGTYTADLVITHTGAGKATDIVPVTIVVGEVAQADMNPDPMYALYAFAITPMVGTAFIEDIDLPTGYTTADINTGTVTINGLTPLTTVLNGSVLEVGFDVADFIATYPLMWDIATNPYTVEGSFSDATPFSLGYEIVCIGHASGDANTDGTVNIGDAVFVINYAFRNGDAPRVMQAADANCDGLVNIGDCVRVVNYVFRGGDAPCRVDQ